MSSIFKYIVKPENLSYERKREYVEEFRKIKITSYKNDLKYNILALT